MVDVTLTIEDLTPAAAALGGHFLAIMKDGTTRKLTVDQLKAFIVAAIVDGSPVTLDTLNELAAALGDDPNFSVTITAALAKRLRFDAVQSLTTIEKATAMGNMGVPFRGYQFGITLSNNASDATNDIDITAGEVASDAAAPLLITQASALTKRTDAAWAAGSGNGGWLDGASMPNGTGHVFSIFNPTTGAVDVGISASLSPTLPTGFTHKRLRGSILRVSAAIVPFSQNDDEFLLLTPYEVPEVANPGTSAGLSSHRVPAGRKLEVIFAGALVDATSTSATTLLFSSPDSNDIAPAAGGLGSLTTVNLSGATSAAHGDFRRRCDTSGRVRYRSSATVSDLYVRCFTLGWFDTRGATS